MKNEKNASLLEVIRTIAPPLPLRMNSVLV